MFLLKSLVLLCIFSVALAESSTVPPSGVPLITGGSDSHNEDYSKNIVSLRRGEPKMFWGDNHFCGGTLIGADVVLTAAHCLVDTDKNVPHEPNYFTVVVGSPHRLRQTKDTVEVKVRQVIVHELYVLLWHDIGILKLQQRVTEVFPNSAEILPINKKPLAANMKCTVLGWGTIFYEGIMSPTLLYVNVTIWSLFECKIRRWLALPIHGIVCANDDEDPYLNGDSCQGDSGGPMVCDGSLAGIVSFGTSARCGHSPGAYTDVYYYRRWIEKNSADKSKGPALIPVLFTILCARATELRNS